MNSIVSFQSVSARKGTEGRMLTKFMCWEGQLSTDGTWFEEACAVVNACAGGSKMQGCIFCKAAVRCCESARVHQVELTSSPCHSFAESFIFIRFALLPLASLITMPPCT